MLKFVKMAKKKKDKETTITNYYDLKKDDIDELVAALKGEETTQPDNLSMNIEEITGEKAPSAKGKDQEFDPYKRDKLSKLPAWFKAFFIKFWFAGAVCYFVNMGLGVYISNAEDLLLLDGVVMGILVDCIVNPIFRMIESDRREYDWYIMFPFPFKKFWTFFANILYYIIVFIGVNYVYMGINLVLQAINENWYLALEPLLFGVFAFFIDMVFIGIKDLIVYLIKKHKRKKAEEVPTDV